MASDLTVLAVNCSPVAGGRTATALRAVLAGASRADATTTLVEMAECADPREVLGRMSGADAFVFGTPMYRASYAHPFKALMDATPRGLYGTDDGPLTARAVTTVATAGSDHHFLGVHAMRSILVDFFAAHLVSPGLYVAASGFTSDHRLAAEHDESAHTLGRALVELSRAISSSEGLRNVAPLA